MQASSISNGHGGIVSNAKDLAELPIDIVFEATGVPWVGAEVASNCIDAGKHISDVECRNRYNNWTLFS